MKKSGKLLTLTKLGMGLVLILCVSLATFFMASCEMITVVVNGKFIDENGNLILTYDDGGEEVVGHVKGVRGLYGCADAGGQGVVEAKTDELNQLIVVYSDGVTDEFGRVEESGDMPDGYADRVRIDSITKDGGEITIHYLRGESVVVDIDCDDKCRFGESADDIKGMIKDEIRPHKADECGIYVCECSDCHKRSVFHGIYHRELENEYQVEEGKNLCEDGGMVYKRCTVCHEVIGDPVPLQPRDHDWEPWGVRTAPTYKEEGVLESYCPFCHTFKTMTIPELPFFFPKTQAEKDATPYRCVLVTPKSCCSDPNGEAEYFYDIDGQSIKFRSNMPAFLHKFNGMDLAEFAVKSENGEVEYSKTDFRLPRIYLEDANAEGVGNNKIEIEKTATCAEPGRGSFICEECGKKIIVETVVPHKEPLPETVIVDVEPGCETPGKGHGPCPVCGEIISGVVVPSLGGHVFVIQGLVHDSGLKGHLVEKCSRCDATKTVDVNVEWIGKKPTCADDGEDGFEQYQYIAEDGTVYKTEKVIIHRKPAHVIKNKKGHVVNIDSIALKKGGQVVTVEDAETGDSIKVIDLKKAEEKFVDVTEFAEQHANCMSCMSGAYGRGYIQCSECGGYLLVATYKNHPGIDDQKSHNWNIKAAKCTEDGYEKYICPDCGYTIDNVLKATGHDPQYYQLIKVVNGEETTFTVKSRCKNCGEDLPDIVNLKVGSGKGNVKRSEVIKIEPDCKDEGLRQVTYSIYMDPDDPSTLLTLLDPEVIPTTGEHLIKCLIRQEDGTMKEEDVRLEDVAMSDYDGDPLKDENGLYVLNVDDERLQLYEFAEQHANCGDCANGKYGRGYYECPKCGENVLIATFKNHTWHEVISEKLPTCEEDGSRTIKCDRCNNTYIIKLPKLGHDYEITIVNEPDFEKGGYMKIRCTRCNKIKTIDLPNLMSDEYEIAGITSASSNWIITVQGLTDDPKDKVTVSFRRENP